MKKLVLTDMEHDTELCLAKLRYEARKIAEMITEIEREETEFGIGSQAKKRKIENKLTPEEIEEDVINEAKQRQIYDPLKRVFNYSKRRVTDLVENAKVSLPKPCDALTESSIELMRQKVMETFHRYREKNCNKRGNMNKINTLIEGINSVLFLHHSFAFKINKNRWFNSLISP